MTLERVCGEIGYPRTIRVDQGSEFVSRDLDLWAYTHNVTLVLANPQTMPSLKPSTARSAVNA